LINPSFTSFLFTLPISHIFITLFFVLSLLLKFSHILTLTKEPSDCISALLTLPTSLSFMQCLLSTNMWSILLHFLLSGDFQAALLMSVGWHHVPVIAKSS
jgi:hypothetical protein